MTSRNENNTTRRVILRTGLAALGGVATKAAGANQQMAQTKIAQKVVQYQDTPKGTQKCSVCVNFEAPAACKIVEGTIKPDGWCIAFGPKSP